MSGSAEKVETRRAFDDDVQVTNVQIDKKGALSPDAAAAALLGQGPGKYSVHRAGSLVVMALDDGTGGVARDGEVLALCGDIGAMPLLGLMNTLGQNRETGRVLLKQGPTERVVLLAHGDVASIGSNLPGDRLGVFLVRLGKISEEDLEAAQVEAQRTGKRMGQVLLARGIIDSHQLWRAIQEQITELFADVMQWEQGSFTLYRLAPGFPMPSTPPLPMQHLLLEAVRRADEMSVFRVRIPSAAARVRRTAKVAPASFEENADLELARRALAALTTEASVADIARAIHVAAFDATRAVYELMKQGLAELVKARVDSGYVLRREDEQKVEIFNVAFREIHDEVVRSGHLVSFSAGVHKYLHDPEQAFRDFFDGVAPGSTGALPSDVLARNLGALVAEGHDASTVIIEALTELTFFMLFQCSAFLDPEVDENLGRRVRLIHASLR